MRIDNSEAVVRLAPGTPQPHMSQPPHPSHPPRESILSLNAACRLGCLAVLLVWQNQVLAVDYTVEGRIKYEIYTSSGGTSVVQEDDFIASVRDCNWHIKKTPIRYVSRGKEEVLGDYGVICSDGIDFYEVLSFNKGESVYGRIGPGSTPFCLTDPKTLVLWYAFASGCQFANQQDKFLNNPFLMFAQTNYAKDFRVRAEWQLSLEAPFLPTYMVFDSKPRFEGATKSDNGAGWQYTNVIYSVKESVKEAGLWFPKQILVDYQSPNPTNRAVLFRYGNITIEATAFRKGVRVDSFRPENLKFHTVSDMRTISSNTPFGVASFNKEGWPALQSSEAKAKSLAVTYSNADSSKQTKSRLILVILLVLPILTIGIWKLSQQKTETSKTRQL